MREPGFLEAYYSGGDGQVWISADQGSRFAKDIAGDFNPIHDAGSSRFCVPGDLLASLVLGHYGLSEHMHFTFRGMVGADDRLRFPEDAGDAFDVTDGDGRVCLHVERSGATLTEPRAVERFIRRYVAFSGQTFPYYLEPLMAEHGVMFNPDRPFVIYDQMGFRLDDLDFDAPAPELTRSTLEPSGRRGEAVLEFAIVSRGRTVGSGTKHLVLSGLRPYDAERMEAFVAEFHRRKRVHDAGGTVG